jgi:hypothetical protein
MTIGALAAASLALAVIAAPTAAAFVQNPYGGGGEPLLLPSLTTAEPASGGVVFAPVVQQIDLSAITS